VYESSESLEADRTYSPDYYPICCSAPEHSGGGREAIGPNQRIEGPYARDRIRTRHSEEVVFSHDKRCRDWKPSCFLDGPTCEVLMERRSSATASILSGLLSPNPPERKLKASCSTRSVVRGAFRAGVREKESGHRGPCDLHVLKLPQVVPSADGALWLFGGGGECQAKGGLDCPGMIGRTPSVAASPQALKGARPSI